MAKQLPKHPVPHADILEQLNALADKDVEWKNNRAFGLVYHHSKAHTELVQSAYNAFMPTNGLNPMAFQSLQRMEHDAVRMVAGLFHGGDEVVGTMTSGGTESILLAILAYRQHARKHRPSIRKPEIIVPESAHAAFYKAGEYFDIRIIPSRLGADYRADMEDMAARINRNTIALVGSAVCYPYGVIDPIEQIGALGLKHNIPVHVDACIGGFMLPFVEKLGAASQLAPITPFDFRVPGVTSMSADMHKYAYAAKGASAIVYRGMDYLRHQFSAATDWCGGIYASPTLAGTRPGGAIAAAWASLHALGEQGLLDNAATAMAATKRFKEGIESIPELEVLGAPVMSILAYGSRVPGIGAYAIGDRLEARRWHVDRLQQPESLHMILNPGHAAIVDEYLNDLKEAIAYIKAHPDAAFEGSAPMYGLIAKAPMRRMVKRQVLALFEKMYSAEGGTPDLNAPSSADESPDVPAATSPVPPLLLKVMKLKARFDRLRRQH